MNTKGTPAEDAVQLCKVANSLLTPVVTKRKCQELNGSCEGQWTSKRRHLSFRSVQLQAKEEKIQKLKLVSHYRKKHSLEELAELARCWTETAQRALADLQDRLQQRGQQVAMAELLRHVGVDEALVLYDAETDGFATLEPA